MGRATLASEARPAGSIGVRHRRERDTPLRRARIPARARCGHRGRGLARPQPSPCRVERRSATRGVGARSSADRALASGARGRRFESCRAHQSRPVGDAMVVLSVTGRRFCWTEGRAVGGGVARPLFAFGSGACQPTGRRRRPELRSPRRSSRVVGDSPLHARHRRPPGADGLRRTARPTNERLRAAPRRMTSARRSHHPCASRRPVRPVPELGHGRGWGRSRRRSRLLDSRPRAGVPYPASRPKAVGPIARQRRQPTPVPARRQAADDTRRARSLAPAGWPALPATTASGAPAGPRRQPDQCVATHRSRPGRA